MVLRDPATFIQTAGEICQLSLPYGHVKTIGLKASQKEKETEAVEDKNTEMQVDQVLSNRSGIPSDSLDTLVHFLIYFLCL